MPSVILNVATTRMHPAPVGTVAGQFRFRLTPKNGGDVLELFSNEKSAKFEQVPAAAYLTSVCRVDAQTGNIIGAEVNGREIQESEFTTNVEVPDTISVTIGV